nr:hypothetical protein [Arsenicitalea aurantiaca]
MLYSYVGASGALVEAAVADGAEGIVVAAFATGSPHRAEQGPALEAAAADGVAVVIGNRGSSGRVPTDNGAFIGADNLTPQKAQILLMMGLTVTDDVEELKRIFSEY